jgi:hypothetical protein
MEAVDLGIRLASPLILVGYLGFLFIRDVVLTGRWRIGSHSA